MTAFEGSGSNPLDVPGAEAKGLGPEADPYTLGLALIGRARAAGVRLRLLGGLGVAVRCPSAHQAGPLARGYSDVDVIGARSERKDICAVFGALQWRPAERFNAANAATRLLFYHRTGQHADVFLNDFLLCHELPLERRIAIDAETITLADLLLTKLQVATLNQKDVTDVAALMLDHDWKDDDRGLNLPYVVQRLSTDWGWWRTVTENLDRVEEHATLLPLEADLRRRVREQIDVLRLAVATCPKSIRWKVRARLGDRVRWRLEPETRG
jgi:hypothetical protein